METRSDNEIMISVRDGSTHQLGILFSRYKRLLYAFFYGINRSGELSEDLVQNTFIRILRYRHLFRGDGNFKAWMFHIARNVSHDYYRQQKLKVEGLNDHHDELAAADDQMDARDTNKMLYAALDRLPADKKEILILSKFKELKYTEIGEILGCTEGAVKVKVFRALQELKNAFEAIEKRY